MDTEQQLIGFNSYVSEFAWRYGSKRMRRLWSEEFRRLTWRRVWVALARAQHEAGLVTSPEFDDIKAHGECLDIARSIALHRELHHEIAGELLTFADQCPIGGSKIHLGATSSDIEDNADIIRIRTACTIIEENLVAILVRFRELISTYPDLAIVGRTHLKVSSATTVGYRFCIWAQNFLEDLREVTLLRTRLRTKGFKGPVGTSAAIEELLHRSSSSAADVERTAMKELDLEAYDITGQTYPRKQDLWIFNALSNIAQSAHKFALDVRVLQASGIEELAEAFHPQQVGSSAMPHKKNPASCEKICSLARMVSTMPIVAWQNAASSILERTLDDAANRRTTIAEGFLSIEEILLTMMEVLRGLIVFPEKIHENIESHRLQISTERILSLLLNLDIPRQVAYRAIQRLTSTEYDIDELAEVISADEVLSKLSRTDVENIFQSSPATGLAAHLCEEFVEKLGTELSNYPTPYTTNADAFRQRDLI
jgi:adenylosuccinate lyase